MAQYMSSLQVIDCCFLTYLKRVQLLHEIKIDSAFVQSVVCFDTH